MVNMDEFRDTDKYRNGYIPAYQRLAGQIGPAGKILEVGVRHGDSLRLWQKLFPDGLVAGADNGADGPPAWPPGTAVIAAGQDSPELAERAREISPDGYDLIIDDASHDGLLSEMTFRLLWPQVKPGGWYVLEDWFVGYLPSYADGSDGTYDDSMLRLAQSFLPMIGGYPPGNGWGEYPSEADVIEYRLGLAIIRRRG
jgi:hypothetical protein